MAAEQPHCMKCEVIEFGVALPEWCADWYGRLAKDLARVKDSKK
jgi:hypothetical protein